MIADFCYLHYNCFMWSHHNYYQIIMCTSSSIVEKSAICSRQWGRVQFLVFVPWQRARESSHALCLPLSCYQGKKVKVLMATRHFTRHMDEKVINKCWIDWIVQNCSKHVLITRQRHHYNFALHSQLNNFSNKPSIYMDFFMTSQFIATSQNSPYDQ